MPKDRKRKNNYFSVKQEKFRVEFAPLENSLKKSPLNSKLSVTFRLEFVMKKFKEQQVFSDCLNCTYQKSYIAKCF